MTILLTIGTKRKGEQALKNQRIEQNSTRNHKSAQDQPQQHPDHMPQDIHPWEIDQINGKASQRLKGKFNGRVVSSNPANENRRVNLNKVNTKAMVSSQWQQHQRQGKNDGKSTICWTRG
eukprot:4935102-Amphidinium_carterae.1